MKAKVDKNVCAGTGHCEALCPKVFKVQDGVSAVQVDVVPDNAEEACRQAMEECPTGAISLDD
jgi:ferredoxin